MKHSLFFAFALLFSNVFGQNFSLMSSSDEAVKMKHTLEQRDVQTILIQNENYRNYAKSHKVVSDELGAPALPFFTESVIIPDAGNVTLAVEYGNYVDYQNVLVAPSKGSLKRNQNPSEIAYSFNEVYSTDAFYPADVAVLGTPYVLRKTRGVTVTIHPYQYNPVTKVLRVYENVQVTIQIDGTTQGENELSMTGSKLDAFTNLYLKHYINAPSVLKRYTPLEESGDLLIITHPDFENELESFVEWKTQKGIRTTVATTNETGATASEIKSYIEDVYSSNPNLLYVLLVGDHEQLPSHTYGTSGSEQLWSDSYYAQLTGGDYYPELFVGRFSASTVEQLTPQIARTLEYEKNPATGTWMMNAVGIGSDEGYGYGDDGEADWQHLRNIRTKLMDFGYVDVYEFYEGSQGGLDAPGNPNSTMINNAINEGIGLYNYTGHGWTEGVSTGNHTNTSVNQLQNNGKYPFVVSVACNNGTFVGATSFTEAWLRATNAGTPSGAIAAAGSSILMAWAQPMQTQDEMAELIAESYATNRKATIGGLFYNSQMSMLETYNASATAREVMQTWVLFGDPSCVFRTKETNDLTATHILQTPQTTTSVDVDCTVEGAFVAIVQDGEIIGTGTVNGGVATISFPVLTSDSQLTVTATKQNYKPYQGIIEIINDLGIKKETVELFSVSPNPTADYVDVKWTGKSAGTTIEVRDVTGKVLYAETSKTQGNTQKRLDLRSYAKGVYFVTLTENGVSGTKKIILK